MLLPFSLLKSFFSELSVAEAKEALTLLGIEVEAVLFEAPPFSHVVAAKVLSARPHEKADQLTIAEVSDGKKTLSIVCGAPNCRAGMKVALAKVGAILVDRAGKKRQIEKTAIRGVESSGMLCSEQELGLSEEEEKEILELPPEIEMGSDLLPLLWDPVFELSLTPNLGHCLSALGIARELSAALQKPLHLSSPSLAENGRSSLKKKISVSVASSDLCPRYMCRLIEGVQIAPSPFWLQKLLKAAGIKPIHNIVDITNYIALKFGQPLHAFDADAIQGGSIAVKTADRPLSFTGLDGIEREVPAGTLLICDAAGPIALAGILGGANSAISEKTKRVLIEAAFFDPMAIRIASKKMGLRTESALRFEKGVDPNGVGSALEEACDGMLKLGGGKLAKGTIDIQAHPFPPKEIDCRASRVHQILGLKLSLGEMEGIFQRLGFQARLVEREKLRVAVPSFRFDIAEEIDLIEEIGRIYGYNHIEKGSALCTVSSLPHDPTYLFEKELRQRLTGLGLQEWITPDLISPKLSSSVREMVQPQISFFQVLHAKTEEYSILRPSLLPGMLQAAKGNFDRKNSALAAFEIGRIHFLQGAEPIELPMAAILLAGKSSALHWSDKGREYDFFDLKGLLEALFEGLRVSPPIFQMGSHLSFHPNRQANLYANDLLIGSLGELHPALLSKFGIDEKILFAELNGASLLKLQRKETRMTPLPSFPSSERDWTIPLPPLTPIE